VLYRGNRSAFKPGGATPTHSPDDLAAGFGI
jgi:hypothetical protein